MGILYLWLKKGVIHTPILKSYGNFSKVILIGNNSIPALNFARASKIVHDGDLVVLNVARKALDAAICAVRPGIMGKEIDLAARKVTGDAGFEKNHLYGAVHGVGLQHCEYPFFGPTTDTIVEEGMFFNIDIGLFDFDFGGVRVENGILVTSDGCKVYTVDHNH